MNLPAVLYTHKEIARVGKTEEELLKKYTREEFVTKIQYFDTNDRSKVTNDTQGFIKVHFTRLTGKIL
jgi:pyruvate/2-oxoglutarate dehydrogenase complex dihydrolipoamide dehydrogenase (E3) component